MNSISLFTGMFIVLFYSTFSQAIEVEASQKTALYVTSGKKLFSGRSINNMPKEAVIIVKELLKVRSTCKKGDEACHLSCANSISMSQYLHIHYSGKMMMDLSGIEARTLDYVNSCLNNSSAQVSPPLVFFMKQMKAGEFTRQLNKILGGQRTAKIPVPDHLQAFAGEEFFDAYEIDSDIEYHAKGFKYETKLTSSFDDVLTAFVTLENYCPVNERGCIRQLMNGKHNITWSKLNTLYATVYPEKIKQEAALTLLVQEFGTLDYEGHPPIQSNSVYTHLKKQPEKYWPVALLTLEKFAKEIIALQPSRETQTAVRLYCEQKSDTNPFFGLDACEYLSAIYFGDFLMAAKYDLLFSEGTLLEYQQKVLAKDDIWATLYLQQKENNQNNPRTGSLIQFILLNYMMEYNFLYSSCLQSDATIYTYSYDKVTEMKNLYGMTLNSWTSNRTESFKVNPNLVPVYEISPFRMNTKSVGFQNMLQSMEAKTPITNLLENKYGIKRLGSTEILKSLAHVMLKNKCDSDIAKKLEIRMIEYNDVRRQYDPYISQFKYNSFLGR
jgi:hypothetical protein